MEGDTPLRRREFLASGSLLGVGVIASCLSDRQKTQPDPGNRPRNDKAGVNLRDGLIIWYRFSDSSFRDGPVRNLADNRKEATAFGDIRTTDGSPIGTAAVFDGVDDYLEVQDVVRTVAHATFMFFKTGEGIAESRLMTTNRSIGGFRLDISGQESIRYILYDNDGDAYSVKGDTPLRPNKYYTATAVWTGGVQRLYLDGELVAESTDAKYTPSFSKPKIGRMMTEQNRYFQGEIAAIGHWRRSLTRRDVSRLTLAEGQLFANT